MQMIYQGGAVWQSTPTLSRPMPHLLDANLPRRLELKLTHQTVSNVKNVSRPNSPSDDALVNARRGNDDNVSADITSDEPGNRLPFTKFPATKPAMKDLQHIRVFHA